MPNIAVRRAGDMLAPAREAVETLLGRRLREEEEVAVMALPGPPESAESARLAAAARMDRVLDRAAEATNGLPEGEFEAAVDEAMERVRRRP